MKNVLITGSNSFIGTSFEKYINDSFSSDYNIETIDMINIDLSSVSFKKYDVVFHVAGIAHVDITKADEKTKQKYYDVNTHLAINTAKKAKADGVKQFIFMSSSIVYGDAAPIGTSKMIYKDTSLSPTNFYGDSKAKAEEGIVMIEDDSFKVCILRCSKVYGKNSEKNFNTLIKIADSFKFVPYIDNQRSMIYIENLCEFVRLLIKNNDNGVFFPQNKEYLNTSELIKLIGEYRNKKIILVKGFEWLIKIFGNFSSLVTKAFGNLTYDKKISEYKEDYCICPLEESIRRTVELK